jgi:hypothetical protein
VLNVINQYIFLSFSQKFFYLPKNPSAALPACVSLQIFELALFSNPKQPFAAKGRTNVELREQFTLASGVSQSMTPFKSKAAPVASPTSSISGEGRNGISTSGPITKVCKKDDSTPPPYQQVSH